ncbi:unnamed protein product [Effrenium voratum]|uniref:Uncharacterized protein n=1 Tax=Effrenium voratum TaxID=2562239 RepID=A0AA36MGS4_9DINO|nr:unnamed protein product [Effrenium voratum]
MPGPGGDPGPGGPGGPGDMPPMGGDMGGRAPPDGGGSGPGAPGPGSSPSGPSGGGSSPPSGGGTNGPDTGGGPGSGPTSPEGSCVPCTRRRLEVSEEASGAVLSTLLRRLKGSPAKRFRRLQGNCCPVQPGEQPSAGQLQAMAQTTTQNQPLETGSKVNACSFTEFFDTTLRECVKGRCRTPYTRPDKDRFCTPISEEEKAAIDPTASVTDSLRLMGLPAGYDMDQILNGGQARARFENEFAKELATQLDIVPSMIVVKDISEGSVIVNFRIDAPETANEGMVPAVVQMSLASVRQNLDALASDGSLLSNTDTSHGVSAPSTTARAQQYSNEEALMQAFNGEALEKVPLRSVETPEIFSLSPIGIGGRSKPNEYLPRSRAAETQDEKWTSPEKVDIDFAIFITPTHNKDPVLAMWARDGSSGYGGNFLANSPDRGLWGARGLMRSDRRVSVSDCETFDWLENLMKDKATRMGEEFVAWANPFTSETLQDPEFCLPEDLWVNTSCEEIETLRTSHQDQYRVACNRELFASSEMRYTVNMPLNDKWIQAENRREGSIYKPEWMLDTLTSFFFTWDKTAEETEKIFSEGAPAGGDVQLSYDPMLCAAQDAKIPCPVKVLYTGKTLYKGEHSGYNRKVLSKTGVSLEQLPASSPTIVPLIEIHMDVEKTVQLVQRGQPKWWPSTERTLREVLQCNEQSYWSEHRADCRALGIEQLPVFPFTVDLEEAMGDVTSARDKSMTLQPGTIYTIDVSIAVMPQYLKDMWGSVSVATFFVEVESVRVYAQALSFKERNEAQLRLKFRLSEKAKAMMKQPVMPWTNFLSSAGAWFGIWGLASVILSGLYSSLRMWGDLGPRDGEATLEDFQAQHEEKLGLKRRQAARKIKAQLEEEYKEYGIRIGIKKVYDLLVQPSSTKGLRSKVMLRDVLKDSNPLSELPEHVASLLGEVRVHLDEMGHQESSEHEDDEQLMQLEATEKQRKGGACPLQ